MESIARDFADADKWSCNSFKMRSLDKFGTMYGFHVRGAPHYQTKVGAIFTMIYFALVIATFGFYITKWADTSRPRVMWNAYSDVKYAEIDLWKENFHFYFVGMDLTTGQVLIPEVFWGSFQLYASILDT